MLQAKISLQLHLSELVKCYQGLRGGDGCYKLWLKQHSNLLKPLEMALFLAKISGIFTVLLHPTHAPTYCVKQLRKCTPIVSAFHHTAQASIGTGTLCHI